ncbi:Rossmann-fold NAD(P)-binding domain-containing protein [Actinoallomurus rhizosphaericola]|uniref:hypothetical protein n=1 Tax=Actinoallomurus rhizosphaericola TaxID=2952536 RepID=UPI0020927AC1|nr:hypothetical protein [Actinoallomurus rhizosphaericola]MCO5998179.1 hypothetical protein [Actinoallomurus rhizosphaericola]
MAGYRYAETTPAEFAATLLRRGEEPWWAYAYTGMLESMRQGRWAKAPGAVTELTGRPPISIGELLGG